MTKIEIHVIEDGQKSVRSKTKKRKKEFKTLGEKMADNWWKSHVGE
jgi:glutamate formiminotransferase